MKKRFLVVSCNPTIQNTYLLTEFRPGRVNRVSTTRLDVAGKGVNVARVLVQLGEEAVHLTQGGGRRLSLYRELCDADGVQLEIIESPAEIRYCHTLISTNDRTITEIVEPGNGIAPPVEREMRASFGRLVRSAHTVIISGSKTAGFSDSIYADMTSEAKAGGARVILDIRGADLLASLAHRPDAVKINVSEFAQTFGDQPLPEETALEQIPQSLLNRAIDLKHDLGIEVVLSNGRRPLLYVGSEGLVIVKPPETEPVNAIGSGDALTAGFAAGLHRGLTLAEAIALGVKCAQQNLMLVKPGSIKE
jgi:tagatose 6-phosphate kinase